jgi:phage gp29-like protein
MAARKSELMSAVRQIGSQSAGVIPMEMTIELLETKAGSGAGGTLFQQSAEYWDKQISKVVLGQTMTSDDGASLSQSKTHERVRFDIRKADARAVAATLNRDLVKPFVDLNYGPQKTYPKIRIQADEPEDTKSLIESVRVFVAMGGKVQMSEVRDRMGLSEPEDGAELLQPESAIAAANAPAPEPVDPNAGPTPGKGKGNASGANEGDPVKGKPGGKNELARRAFSLETLRDDAIEDWQPLLEGSVGRIISELQKAESFEEMRKLLDELEAEAGDRLDVGPLVSALARESFRMRGIGDATDRTDV